MDARCPFCLSTNAVPAFTVRGYSYLECSSCSTLFVHPRPTPRELSELYQSGKEDLLSSTCWSGSTDSHRHDHRTWQHLLRVTEELAGRGPLLDMACGTGQFLALARELGWTDLTGIEVVPEAARAAANLTGAKVLISDINEVPLSSQSFNAVVLWDIIEHVSDVHLVLREARRLLRPAGVLLMGSVNRHGLSLRLLGPKALTVAPPEHLTFPTRKGVAKAMAPAGFDLVQCWSNMIFLREWTRFLPVGGGSEKSDASYSQCRSTLTSSRSFRATMTIINVLLKRTNLGDELVVVAQKPLSPPNAS